MLHLVKFSKQPPIQSVSAQLLVCKHTSGYRRRQPASYLKALWIEVAGVVRSHLQLSVDNFHETLSVPHIL